MASLKAIRKRISSVKNTQKITRAMKLVAAARLRRAQENILQLRPYALKTLEVLSAVAMRVTEEEEAHPLLARREPKRVMLVVLTSDRGLAGAFNANINKAAYREWREREAQGQQVEFAVIGRKGRDFLRRRGANITRDFTGVFEDLSWDRAGEIGRYVVNEYTEEGLDACFLVYNEFKSAMTQHVTVEPLLPITPTEAPEGETAVDFIYEPSKGGLLDTLLPLYVEVEVYRALLESVASEHGPA
jgi:F-type H+-transporting ATPase subunit gamma